MCVHKYKCIFYVNTHFIQYSCDCKQSYLVNICDYMLSIFVMRSNLTQAIQHSVIVCQSLATDLWFSPGVKHLKPYA